MPVGRARESMRVAIAFYVHSLKRLDRDLDYESISPDHDDYQRCVARERTLAMRACEEAGVPYFLIVDIETSGSVRASGYAAQRAWIEHRVYNQNRQPVTSLSGYDVLLLASVAHEQTLLACIEELGGRNIADFSSQQFTLAWYKLVDPAYLKRKLAWFPLDCAWSADFDAFRGPDGQFFCKTNYKLPGRAGLTRSLAGLFEYQLEIMPASTEIIVSEPLSICEDSRGKLEYRCFVIGHKLSSVSRPLDYDTAYEIPEAVFSFVRSFIERHIEILPPCYVVDVALDEQRGPVVIEMNGIVAAGRYERNSFPALLTDLSAAVAPSMAETGHQRASGGESWPRFKAGQHASKGPEMSMKRNGEIASTDWKLFLCARETGREGLIAWGPEDDARAELNAEAERGHDVWLISPTGEKVLPDGSAAKEQNLNRLRIAESHLGEMAREKTPYFVVNSNELPVPAPMPKYMVIELDHDADPIWAYFVETLDEAARAIDSSDTDCVGWIKVYDLDTGTYQLPEIRVAAFSEPKSDTTPTSVTFNLGQRATRDDA